ncbi:MAG: hypothetical protein MUF58_10540 [Arcicella sp.]|jgi:hypothetical protein|nr:hypothetical protein [Arcicella sp.]
MTFIASVIARDGVAVIADSLVTSSKQVIELNDFLKFVESKTNGATEIPITVEELYQLFRSKDSHTKDYEEKLFQYDKYTAVTTAGNAIINKKRIREIIESKVLLNEQAKLEYEKLSIHEKLLDFCEYIENELKNHLNNEYSVGRTIFIITHFDKESKKTVIYKIETNECTKDDLNNIGFKFVNIPEPETFKVVCDGQNRISENILFGGIGNMYQVTVSTIRKIKNDFKLGDELINTEYINSVIKEVMPLIDDDIHITKLSELSLQQAVDLASLLMKIEIDFQKYTTNIPTVGGVIKIATINKDGFKFVSGNEIIKPKIM